MHKIQLCDNAQKYIKVLISLLLTKKLIHNWRGSICGEEDTDAVKEEDCLNQLT